MTAGGAVAVVVEGEPGPVASGGLSSSLSWASSWASTTAASPLDRAQRPAGESPELDRVDPARLRHERGLHGGALLVGEPGGSREVAWAITEACSGDRSPRSRASGWPASRSSRSVASLTARAAAAPPERVCVREPCPGRRAPGLGGHRRLLGGGDQLELQRVRAGHGPSELGDRAGVLTRPRAVRRRRPRRAPRAPPPPPRPGGRAWGGARGPLSWAIILEHVFEQQGQQAPVEDPVHPAYDRITGVADGLQASTMRA